MERNKVAPGELAKTTPSQNGALDIAPKEVQFAHGGVLMLSRKKMAIDNVLAILEAIEKGSHLPSEIMSSCKLSWMNVIQGLQRLEQNGLVSTVVESESQKRLSVLTKEGYELLHKKN